MPPKPHNFNITGRSCRRRRPGTFGLFGEDTKDEWAAVEGPTAAAAEGARAAAAGASEWAEKAEKLAEKLAAAAKAAEPAQKWAAKAAVVAAEAHMSARRAAKRASRAVEAVEAVEGSIAKDVEEKRRLGKQTWLSLKYPLLYEKSQADMLYPARKKSRA